MTTTDRQTIKLLLRELVAGFVEKPEAIEIREQPAQGACYWMMRVAPEDDPKAIGKGGTHARAIATLIAAWGDADGEEHTFRLLTAEKRPERAPEKIRDVMDYDVEPRRVLLEKILALCGIDAFAVEAGPGEGARNMLMFRLSIRLGTESDHKLLLRERVFGTESTTIAGAIATLFRAIALKDGVNIDVAIHPPVFR